jgi:hypothetical protein
VEDDGQGVTHREASDPEGDGDRAVRVEQRASQEVLGVVGARHLIVLVIVHLASLADLFDDSPPTRLRVRR